MDRNRRNPENLDDMSATPKHGDRLANPTTDAQDSRDSGMHEDAASANRTESQRSRRTGGRANDERWDEAGNFSGKGNQREGAEQPEGTGYREGSNTEESADENPLA